MIKIHKFSVAPMVDKTDRHFRYFLRAFSKKSLFYTEMITAKSIIHGDKNKILDFDPIEKPLALQLAGDNVEEMVEAVKIAENWDYDEINLNIGCPSDRISGNNMGAVLMAYPFLVRDMVIEIKKITKKPVTVKHRIGIDGTGVLDGTFENKILDSYEYLKEFVSIIDEGKPDRLTIHGRIAILKGLSPKENREVPPLNYDFVYKVKKDFPHLNIELNGGIKTKEDIDTHLKNVDSVMIGREIYDNPYFLNIADSYYDVCNAPTSREEAIENILDYVDSYEKNGFNSNSIIRHLLGLYHGQKNSKLWKNSLNIQNIKKLGGKKTLIEAIKLMKHN